MQNDSASLAIAQGLAGAMQTANPGWTHAAAGGAVRSAPRRFWPVQRRADRTVYDAELGLDIDHVLSWSAESAQAVADSLNNEPSYVACWFWAGSDVWTDPEDRVPPELCVANGGHNFGEGAVCSGCDFSPIPIGGRGTRS